ncbi:MAG: YDG domain-containing protein [Steroidobacter sp.]
MTAGNVTLKDTNAMRFAATTLSGNLIETTQGPISSTGAVQVGGTTNLTANSGGFGYADPYIDLTNGSNHFTGGVTLSVPSLGTTNTGGYAYIRDSGAITIASSNTKNDLQVYAGGAINVTSATSVGSGILLSTSTGAINTTTLNAGNWIQITTSNGTVNTTTTTAGSSLSVSATGAVDLGDTALGTDLTVSTGAAITDSGTLTVPHQTTLTAGTGNNITLDSANNDFSAVRIVNGKDVTLVDKNAINFGGYNGGGGYTSHIYGNLDVTAAGDIAQINYNSNDGYSAVTVDGTSTFRANNGSAQINLYLGSFDPFGCCGHGQGQANTFTGTVTLVANNGNTGFSNVQLRNISSAASVLNGLTSVGTLNNVSLRFDNAPSVTLPGMTLTGNLNVYAPNVANTSTTPANIISQTGPIVVGGDTIMAAASTGDIVLTDANNDFSRFGIANTGARDLTLVDKNAISLYAQNYNMAVTRNWTVTAGGDIADVGNNITVPGTATFDAGTHNVDLTHANELLTTLAIPAANNVTVNSYYGLVLDNVNTTGNLTLQARNTCCYTLTQLTSTAVNTPTNSTTTFNNFYNGITLGNDNNVLGNLAMSNAGAITIRENDAITQASAWTNYGASGGNTTRYAVNLTTSDDQAITLDQAGSVFGNLTITQVNNGSVSPGAVYVRETGDSYYGMTEGSAWTVHGTTKVDAGSYSINLNNANNVFGPLQVLGATGLTNGVASTVTIYAKDTATANAITDVGGTGAWNTGTGTVKMVAYDTTGTTAGGGNIDLENTGNVLGDLYIKSDTATITENDNITDGDSTTWFGTNTGWVTTGATNFVIANPAGKSITLDNLTNQLGPISIHTAGTAGTLSSVLITDNTDLTQSEAWLVGSAPVTLDARHHAIDLSGYDNVLGDVTINTVNGTPTSVSIKEDDPITQGSDWIMSGVPVTLVAKNDKAITLTNAANVMGNLTLTGGAVSITENDDITQGSAWTTTGTTTLDIAATGKNIVLTNTGNVLGPLAISGTPNAVSITENDDITQASAWVQGTTPFTLNSGSHDIVLSQSGNVLGDLTLTGQNATVVESDSNGITDGNAWTIPGTTTLTAGAANPIVLNANPSSDLGTVSIVSASNADINDVNGIVFGDSTIASGGTLTVTAAGAITQTGAITSPYLRLIGTGNATLTNVSNNVQNLAAGFSGGDLAFTNDGDFDVAVIGGTSGITIGAHNVTLTSVNGTITGLSTINASTSSLTLSTGTALSVPQMSIAGPQSYTASTVSGSGITLNASVTSTASGTIDFNSPVALGADLTVQSTNSNITFHSTLDGGGNQLTVNAGSGVVEFMGAVSALGSTGDAGAALQLTSSNATFDSTLGANNGLAITGPVVFKDDVTLADGNSPSIFAGQVTLGKSGGMSLSGYDGMTFNNGVVLQNGPATINSNNAAMSFQTAGSVDGPYDLTLNSGTQTLSGLDRMGADLTSLTVTALNPTIPSGGVSIAGPQSYTATSGSSITLNGNVTSTAAGTITFNSPVVVGTNATVTSSNSDISFVSTVDGNKNLTVDSGSGTKTFTGAIGVITPLGSGTGAALVLQGSGATTFSSTVAARSGITAAGDVTFDDDVTLTHGDTGSTFNGLVTTGGTDGNTISGHDGIAFNGGLALVGGPVSVISNGSDISFGNTVSGPQNLTLNALSGGAGTITGLDQIGFASVLTSLSLTGQTLSLPSTGLAVAGAMSFTAPGGITLNGAVGNNAAPATGQIDFNSAVNLATGAITITNNNAAVNFASTVNGAQDLNINNGSGTTTFSGAVGGGTPLSSLTTDATGTTVINGGAISTSGAQTYNDAVTVGATTTLSGVDVHFVSTVNGANALTVNDSGTTTFSGIVGGSTPLSSLTTDAAGNTAINTTAVTTSGAQIYNDAVTLGVDTTLTGNPVTFNNTVDGAHSLSANASGGALSFNGTVGGSTPLTSLTATGNTVAAHDVTTSGTQDYSASGGITLNGALTTTNSDVTITGPTTLGGDVTISTDTGAGDITFSGATSTINGAHGLTLTAGDGDVVLGGVVGGVNRLTSIAVTGKNLTLPGINTVGDANQTYTALDNITLNQSRTLSAPISFTADANNDGVGSFILPDGVSLTASNNTLSITAADLDLQGSSTLSSGSGVMTITASTGRNLQLGGTDAAGQMTISGDELSRITSSGGLNLQTTGTGWIHVTGITPAQSQNITGVLSLNAQGTGDIGFITTPSTFNAVTSNAAGGTINVAVDLTATNDPIEFDTPVAVAGASTINSGGGNITFQDTVDVNNDLVLTTSNGVLTFNGDVGSNKTLVLNLGGGSVSGLGHLQNTLTGLTVNSSSGITLPAFTINGPQVYNTGVITATGDLGGIGLTFNNVVNVTPGSGSALTFDAGTGTLQFNNLVGMNTYDVTMTGDEINFTHAVTGSGALVLQPSTLSRNVAVGGSSSPGTSLNLTATDMAQLPIGSLSSITIGRSDGSGTLDVAGVFNAPLTPVTLNGGGGISQSGGSVTSAALTLFSNAGITLANASNNLGDISINGAPASVNIADSTDITQGAAWVLGTAPATLNAGAGSKNITLTQANNTFGTLSLTGANVQVTEAASTDLGASTATTLTVRSTGAITTSGTVAVSGLADLKTLNDAGANITVANSSTFGSVSAASRNAADTANTGGNISLSLADSTLLKTIATTGDVSLTGVSGKTFSEDGTSALSSNGLELLGAGVTYTLALGNNAITTLAGDTGSLNLVENSGFDIGTVNTVGLTTTGNTTLSTTGTVTQSQALSANGLELLGTGGTYTLTNTGNNITTLAGNTGVVSVVDNTGFDIGTVNTVGLTTTGNTTLSTTGTITQSKALVASGLELLGTGGVYTLTNTGNAITTLAGNTGSLNLVENTGYDIGTVNTAGLTLSGNATLSTTGTVTQSQALSATGLELLGIGGTYTLTNTANNITTLAGTTGAVSVVDNAGFDVGTVNTIGLTTTGNTTLSSTGTVTQSQALSATGLELLGAGGTYILTNTSNAITTLAGNTGSISLVENSGFDIGTVNTAGLTTSGNTTLSSTGTVTQSQALKASGLELLGTGGVYTLTNTGNAITTLAGNTGSLNLVENSGYDIGTVNTIGLTLSGSTTLSTTGTVTQSQALTTNGLELLGTGGTYTLTNTGNAIATLAGNTGNVSVADNNGFAIGTVNTVGLTTSGNTSLSTTATVTQSQALHAAGLELLGAGGTFTLDNSSNAITTLAGNTGIVRLTENSGYDIGTVNSTGLTTSGIAVLTSTGTVTQSQDIATSGLGLLGTGGVFNFARDTNTIPLLAANTGSLTVHTSGALLVGSVNPTGITATGNVAIKADGAITQTQPLVISGNLTLETTDASVGDVAITNTVPSATVLGETFIGGDYTLTATNKDVSQYAGSNLQVAGDLNIDAASLSLGGAGNLVGGTTTTPSVAELRQSGVIHLGDITATGNYSVISVASSKSFSGSPVHGAAITLNNTSNSIGGYIAVKTVGPSVTSGSDVQTGIDQQAGTTLSITGVASFTAESSSVSGSGFIHLDNTGNSFGSLVLSGTDVSVTEDTGATVINSANASTSLAVVSGGAVTQTGGIVTPQLAVTSNGAVTLTNTGNNVDTLAVSSNAHNISYVDADGFDVGTVSGVTGIDAGGAFVNLTAGGSGNITQSSAVVNAATLTMNAGGSINLDSGPANTIDALGTVIAGSGIAVGDSTGGITISGNMQSTSGDITVHTTGGDLTIADTNTITAGGSGNIYLAAGAGYNFINNDSTPLTPALVLGTGRFIIYSKNNTTTVKGGLTGSEYMGETYALNGPSTQGGRSGNLFIYNDAATLLFTADDQSRAYGSSNPTLTYTVTGYLTGDDASSAFSGVPLLSTAATSTDNVGAYTISISSNTLSSSKGYLFAFADGTLNVTPYVVNLSGSRAYDGTTAVAAGNLTIGTLVGSETLTLSGSGTMSDKHIGTGKSFSIGTLTLGNGTGLASNYTLTGGTRAIDITAAPLTVTTSNVTKTYDGTTSAAGTAVVKSGSGTQLFGTDTLSGGTYAFTNANAGSGNKTVNVSGVTVNDGNSGNDYSVTYADNTTSTINPYVVSLTGSRTYDGTVNVAAGALTIGTLVGSETLTLSGAGTVANKDVGTGKAVSIGTLTLGNGTGLASNYTLTGGTDTVNITAAPLTITTSNVTKTYDGTTSAAGTAVVKSGSGTQLFGTDTLSGGTYAFTNANAGSGNKTVNVSGVTVNDGNSGNDYSVTYADNTTSTINPYVVSLTGSRTYDGTVNVAAGALTIGTLVGSETLTLSGSGTMSDKHIGTGKSFSIATLTLGNGTGLASNYTLTGGTRSVDISAAPLTISTSNVTKTYDGTLTAAGSAVATVGTVFSGDSLSGGTFAFTNANAGSGNKTVNVSGVTVNDGNSGDDYSVTYADNTTSTINPASIMVSTSDVTKTYDGSVTAAGTAVLTAGSLYHNVSNGNALDKLSGGTFVFTNANAGSGNKTVDVSGVTVIDGNSGNNYTITYADNTTSTINPYVVNITGSRTYDGTKTVAAGDLTLGALVGSETLTLSGSGTVASKNVGNGKTISLGTLTLGNGTGLASNYTFTGGSQTIDITAAPLTISTTDVTRTYDGTLSASGTAVAVSGTQLFGTDSLSGGTFTFTDANAGIGNKVVTTSGVTVNDGNGGSNYAVTYVNNTTSTINPASITISTGDVIKTYDGTVSANGSAVVISGALYHNASNGNALDNVSGGTFAFTDANAGSGNKTVTVSGVTVTDGNSGNNYAVTYTDNTTSTINKKALTLAPVIDDKEYDGTNLATIGSYGFVGLVGSETLNASFSGATFSDKNAGVGKGVTISGITLQNGANGGLASNYTAPSSTLTTGNILPKVLTVNATVSDKVYDGTTNATITGYGLSGFVGSETVVGVSSGTATFVDKNVGNNKSVSITGIGLINGANGGLASNYTVGSTASTTASITPATLQVAGVVAIDKVYDGTTAANVNTMAAQLTGVIGSDDVQVGTITGTFASKNVGNNIPVTGSGFVLTGTDAQNYNLVQPTGLAANITPRSLVITATGVDKMYDGTTAATATLSDDRITGDVFNIDYNAAFLDKNAGVGKFVNISGITLSGTDAANYSVNSTAGAFASITPRPLSVTVTANDKVYDGTAVATASIVDSALPGDVLTLSYGSAAFADKNVGTNKTVTISNVSIGGADAGNYSISASVNGTASITPATLTVSATGNNKVYDGTANATVTLSDNHLGNDVLSLLYNNASFTDKNAGSSKIINVNGITVGGADAGNYVVTNTTATTQADITPAQLVVTASGVDKVYDGTAAATVTLSDDRIAGDVFNINYNASFLDKNAGVGKFVNVSGITLSGADAANYSVNSTAGTVATIAPRVLNVSISANDKVYDGTTSATASVSDDRLSSDSLTLSYSAAAFADKNVGANKAVTINNVMLSGADAGNYSVNATASSTASITPATLTIAATGNNKVYDGNANATVTLSDNHLGNDVLSLLYNNASFTDKNAGVNKVINVNGVAIGGPDAGNYVVASTTVTTHADITPATLAITATGVDKVYDGTTNATVNFADNHLAGDVLSVSYGAANFEDETPGTDKTIDISGIYLSGADAANYSVVNAATAIASITPASQNTTPEVAASNAYLPAVLNTATTAANSTGSVVPAVDVPMQPVTIGNAADTSTDQVIAAPVNTVGGRMAPSTVLPGVFVVMPGLSAHDQLLGDISVQLISIPSSRRSGVIAVTVPDSSDEFAQGFSFTLPQLVADTATLDTVSISTMSGGPVPDWLQYVPATKTFIVSNSPSVVLPLQMQIRIGNQPWIIRVNKRQR